MKRILCLFLILIVSLTVCSCKEEEMETVRGFHFDTLINISVDKANVDTAREAFGICRTLEDTFSRTKKESELYKINSGEVSFPSSAMLEVMDFAVSLSENSNGAFDITVAPLCDLWNIKERTEPPAEEEISAVLESVGYKNITLSPFSVGNAKIDLGAIGKGYAADRIKEEFLDKGIDRAIIDLGGNVQLIGEFSVGIRDPFSPDGLFAKLTLKDKSAVTSGAYQRYFEHNNKRYHHILDPRTGHCAESGVASVTVIADSSMQADALSTAIFVLGKDGLKLCDKYPGTDALLIMEDGEIITTEEFSQKYELTMFKKN